VTLEVHRDVPSLPVMGDPIRLQQMLVHLATNAVKFTPAGGRVDVQLAREEANWRVTVSDTGRGVPEQLLPRIFEGCGCRAGRRRAAWASGSRSCAISPCCTAAASRRERRPRPGLALRAPAPGPGTRAVEDADAADPQRRSARLPAARPGRLLRAPPDDRRAI
jgi:hypothetical protein